MPKIKLPKEIVSGQMAVQGVGLVGGFLAYGQIQKTLLEKLGSGKIGDWDREISGASLLLAGGLVAANAKGAVRSASAMVSLVGAGTLGVALLRRFGVIKESTRVFSGGAMGGNGNGNTEETKARKDAMVNLTRLTLPA